ncbi:ATP-binding protein [Marinicellulosiphila megalodicopiae]|uniref:ATP-binding protein n=1 Tax=Marinicellulosiphila megalodicopiae TaxID=2724896 RepID=UPI003BAECDEF
MKYPRLSKLIWLKTLPWLVIGLVLIMGIQLYLASFVVKQRMNEQHQNYSDLIINDIENFIENAIEQTESLAKNAFIVNGLIDDKTKKDYIPIFFGSLNFSVYGKTYIGLADYKGRIIHANNNEEISKTINNYIWKDEVLNKGNSFVKFDTKGVFIATPVVYFEATEGAVISFYPIEILEAYVNAHENNIWAIYDKNNIEIIHSDNHIEGSISYYEKNIIYEMVFRSYNEESSSFKQLKIVWIFVLFTIFSVFFFTSIVLYFSTKMSSKFFINLLSKLEGPKNSGMIGGEESYEFNEISKKFNQLMSDLNKSYISNNKIISILNSMEDVIFVMDFTFNLQMNNEMFNTFKQNCGMQNNKELLNSSELFYDKKTNSKDICHYINRDFEETIMRWSKQYLIDENERQVGYVFIGTDITKEFLDEQKIRVINQAISELPNGLIMTNNLEDGNPIIYANQSFYDITGYSEHEVIGSSCNILQGEDTDKKQINKIRDSIKLEKSYSGIIKNYKKNGDEFWNELKICPVKNADDDVTHFVGIQVDATARIRQEEQLVNAKKNAEASAQLKSEFLANMSHEIRTPMNGIIGTLNILKKQKLNENQNKFAKMAQSSALSLLGIINDILDFSKIEAGKLEIENIEISLYQTIVDSMQTFILKSEEAGINLSLNIDMAVCNVIMSDPTRIRQIITNLLSNAIKFTNNNGSNIKNVSVNVSAKKSKKGQLIKVEVCDTGIGIPKNKIDSLFDKFTQVDASTTRNYGGTGLGLSIVHQLSNLMGGDIVVESEVGKGSKFIFSLDARIKCESVSWLNKCDKRYTETCLIALALTGDIKHTVVAYLNALGIIFKDYVPSEVAQNFEYIITDTIFENTISNDAHHILKICNNDDYISTVQEISLVKIPIIFSILDLIKLLKFDDGIIEIKDNTEFKIPLLDKRILLVEDNGVNQIVAQTILEEFGCIVTIQSDGQQAVDLLNSHQTIEFDLILMDCQMPVLDGYQATEKIRKESLLSGYQKMIIVAMTANVMKGDKEKCLKSGMDDYIAKPIDENELLLILQKWLDK